jgi:hypothetical protein
MATGENAMNKQGNTYQADMDTVINYVIERIQYLTQNLNTEGLGSTFGTIARKEIGHDDFGMIGSFVFDIYVLQGICDAADFMLEAGNVTEGPSESVIFNDTVIASFEAYSLLKDSNTYNRRYNCVQAYYPKGRNAAHVTDPNKKKQFNTVANQNFAPDYNMEAELIGLYEVLEKLEKLEKKHVQYITFEEKKSAGDTINALHYSSAKHGGVDMLNSGVRKAV